jgi:outer membrane receptor protein involved in Fe transport
VVAALAGALIQAITRRRQDIPPQHHVVTFSEPSETAQLCWIGTTRLIRSDLMGSFMASAQRAAAAVALAFVAAQPILAEQPAAETVETTEVIVTGSRIKQPNLTSTSPIQVVSEKDIQLNGTTDMISLLNTLPQQFMNNVTDFSGTSQVLAGAGGISTADLRGLGPQRTLVLVDGKRLGTGDANTANGSPAPDLNQIPVQLVQRVDVVTGGASAVYGSDAIAGVVNFVMKRNFEGVMIDAQYGFDDHTNGNSFMQDLISKKGFAEPPHHVNDGYNRTAAIIVGMNGADDRGNATAYFTYLKQDPVSQARRDFSACKLNVVAPDSSNIVDVPSCSGSSNSNFFQPLSGPNALKKFSVVGDELLPYPQAGSVPPPLFNSNLYQYLLHQDERYTGGLMSHYDLNEHAKVYADLNVMNDRTLVLIGPSGAFQGGNPFDPQGNGGYIVPCNNPLLSAQEQGVLCGPGVSTGSVDINLGRRNVEGVGRTSYFEHINYRAVLGVEGDIVPDTWSYDAYAQYYYTSLYFNQGNDLSNTNIGNALNVAPDGTCGAGCVPWNIWKQGAVTPQQLAYLVAGSLSYGTVRQEIFSGSVTGNLDKYGVRIPTANEGLRINFGAERRAEALNYQPDKTAGSGDLSGGAGAAPTINGGYSVNEIFGEARLPLAQGLPGFHDLSFETGFRYSRYSTAAGSVSSYKLGLQYAPIEDVRLRLAFQRAIRAPNILELFNPATVTQTSTVSTDPCAGDTPAATLQQCEHTGVTAAQYGHIADCPAGQCSALLGGNPNLKSETANTASIGLTLTPSFLPGFTGSIDYYRIKIDNEISTVPVNIDLALCLNLGNPAACALIQRGPNGQLFGQDTGFFRNINDNLSEALVSGIDVQMQYGVAVPGGWGRLEAALNGAFLQKNELTPLKGFTYDCAGLYGVTCQTLNPKWRHNLRLSWQTPWKVLLSAQWRYIGPVSLDTNDSQPSLQLINNATNGGTYDPFDARLGSRSYLDLSGTWEVTSHIALRAGVNNVLDRDPPLVNSLVSQTGSPNSFPTYDLLGRVIFVGAQARF